MAAGDVALGSFSRLGFASRSGSAWPIGRGVVGAGAFEMVLRISPPLGDRRGGGESGALTASSGLQSLSSPLPNFITHRGYSLKPIFRLPIGKSLGFHVGSRAITYCNDAEIIALFAGVFRSAASKMPLPPNCDKPLSMTSTSLAKNSSTIAATGLTRRLRIRLGLPHCPFFHFGVLGRSAIANVVFF
jgi:hypothetical protein